VLHQASTRCSLSTHIGHDRFRPIADISACCDAVPMGEAKRRATAYESAKINLLGSLSGDGLVVVETAKDQDYDAMTAVLRG